MADANHILSGTDATDEQLLSYLEGKLQGEELAQMEKQMQDDAFVADAIEGLQQFSSNKKLDQYVRTLNQNLHQQLANRKKKRWQRRLESPAWLTTAVVIILLLCLLGYVVVKFVESH